MRGTADAGAVRAAVIDLLVGDAVHAQRAAEKLTAANAWGEACACASRWNVSARFHARLDETMPIPADLLATLRVDVLRAGLRSRHLVERGAGVLVMFREAGIDGMAIKGVGAIATLGARAAARTTTDLDVVVRERDAAAARALLHERGFEEVNPPFEQHMRDIALSRQLHNVARTLRKDELEVDLHWRFGPNAPQALAAEHLLERAVDVAVGASTIRAARPVDAVLIAVHHALRSSFVPENAARDVCDLVLWWEDGRVIAGINQLLDAAQASGLATSLLALWSFILRRNPGHPLRLGQYLLTASLDPAERAEAALLAQHLEDVVRVGNPARFTLEVFAPRLYARSAFGTLARTLRPEGTAAQIVPHRPLAQRVANLPRRCWRIARELTRIRSIASYRAVAQAQSRFH